MHFPQLNGENFDAIKKITKEDMNGDWEKFALHQRILMEGLDPYLLGCVYIDSTIQTGADSEEEMSDDRKDFFLGAFAMHRVLWSHGVLEGWYSSVSKETAQTYMHEQEQLLKGVFTKLEEAQSLEEKITTVGPAFEQSIRDSEGEFLTFNQMYQENPGLEDLVEYLPNASRMGAIDVYKIVRKQYLNDQLGKSFNL